MSATCSGVKSRRGRRIGTLTIGLAPSRSNASWVSLAFCDFSDL